MRKHHLLKSQNTWLIYPVYKLYTGYIISGIYYKRYIISNTVICPNTLLSYYCYCPSSSRLLRIRSFSYKSVHNRSNVSCTLANTRTHTQPGIIRRGWFTPPAPLATPHTIILRIETHRSLRDCAFPTTRT
jgi:hypothetical protein